MKTETLTVAQVRRLGLKYDQPTRAPGELVTCFVPGRLVNPKNAGIVWRNKVWGRYNREWRERTWDALLLVGYHGGPAGPKRVAFHATVPSKMDSDGLALACASIRDALITAGIIDDDRDSAGHEFIYSQTAKRKDVTHGVEIRVRLRVAHDVADVRKVLG